MPTPNISRDPTRKLPQSTIYIRESDQNAFVTTPEDHEDSKRMFVSPSPNQGPASQIDNHDTSWGGNPPTRSGGPISTSYDGGGQIKRVNGNLPYIGPQPGMGPYTAGAPKQADPYVAGAVPRPNEGNRSRARHWKDNPTGHQPHGGVRNPDVYGNGPVAPNARHSPTADPGVKSRKGY